MTYSRRRKIWRDRKHVDLTRNHYLISLSVFISRLAADTDLTMPRSIFSIEYHTLAYDRFDRGWSRRDLTELSFRRVSMGGNDSLSGNRLAWIGHLGAYDWTFAGMRALDRASDQIFFLFLIYLYLSKRSSFSCGIRIIVILITRFTRRVRRAALRWKKPKRFSMKRAYEVSSGENDVILSRAIKSDLYCVVSQRETRVCYVVLKQPVLKYANENCTQRPLG